MSISLTPEQRRFIDEAIRPGAHPDRDQAIARALELLRGEETSSSPASENIQEKLTRGLAQLDRGEGMNCDQSRARIDERKAAWLSRNSTPNR